MALVPMIQPPIIRLLTTEKERAIQMVQLRHVTKLEKNLFSRYFVSVSGIFIARCGTFIRYVLFWQPDERVGCGGSIGRYHD